MHDTALGWRLINPRMAERYSTEAMGETAENVAERYGDLARGPGRASRSAATSAPIAARAEGRFAERDRRRSRRPTAAATSRSRSTPTRGRAPTPRSRSWRRCSPVFREGGTVTAGNASTLNDGAACLVLGIRAQGRRARRRAARASASPSASPASTPPYMGIGPVPAIRAGARRGRARARRDRPDRDQRGVRRPGARLRARARNRRGAAQRQRRRDRARPPARLLGRAADDHAGLGAAPPRRPLRDRHPLRRRRPGRRDRGREPAAEPRLRTSASAAAARIASARCHSTELASVDGPITATAEAAIPVADDGLLPRRRRLRGDPPLRRPAVRARRAPRPPRALGRGDRAAGRARAARGRDRGAARARSATPTAQLRLVAHPRRAPDRCSPSRCPPRGETVRLATVTYSPTVILTGVKSLSYAANMQATRIAQGKRRRRGDPRAPRRDRARGADLDDLLGLAPRAGCARPSLDDRHPRVDHPRPRSSRELHVEEGEFALDDLLGAARGVPRLDHPRGAADLGDRRPRAARCPGPRTARRSSAFARALERGARRRGRRACRWTSTLTDEQRLIAETAREFVDNEVVPRARDNDRAERFDRELARKLGEMGYLGAPVAEEYGGRGPRLRLATA